MRGEARRGSSQLRSFLPRGEEVADINTLEFGPPLTTYSNTALTSDSQRYSLAFENTSDSPRHPSQAPSSRHPCLQYYDSLFHLFSLVQTYRTDSQCRLFNFARVLDPQVSCIAALGNRRWKCSSCPLLRATMQQCLRIHQASLSMSLPFQATLDK